MKHMKPEIRLEKKTEERNEVSRPRGSVNAREDSKENVKTCPCCSKRITTYDYVGASKRRVERLEVMKGG